jgi:hypothetical protein
MPKDTEKNKTLPIPFVGKVRKRLIEIQAKRQLRDGFRTSLKDLASEIIERAEV